MTKVTSSYVFILCPPYSGSTLLWKLVSTSDAVSAFHAEGQFLPEVCEEMRQDPWNPAINLSWDKIKRVWDGYWDLDKTLLVEKSPPNLIRAYEIENYFDPVYFLIMVRDPYAHCEGLMRRNNWDAQKSAEFSIFTLKQQAENSQRLRNTLSFTYEQLVLNPRLISEKIQAYIPGLGALKYGDKFKIHSIDGVVEREIVDLNKKKIENLSSVDVEIINKVLKNEISILSYWGYEMRTTNFLSTSSVE